jgi:2',3'-cyclic-nucleotide 2'-phosphodiesterase (5'-nucleotidase family)
VRVLNLVGYDAAAVGNHEFDFGRGRLEESRREARFAWLSANTLGPGGEPALPPYDVREVAGVRVGVLGLVTPGVAKWESPELVAGLTFGDTVAAAKKYVPVLRGKERCDLVVVLAHESFERDLKTGTPRPGAPGDNQAYALATEVEGIDFLLTGHAHSIVTPQRLGPTWLSQPGRWGNTLTRFDATLERTPNGKWTLAGVRGRNLPMRGVEPDAEVVAAIEPEHADTMRLLAEPLAVLPAGVSSRNTRTEDSGMVDWTHRVQLSEGKAQLSFASVLAFGPPLEWPAGPLTLRQVWQFYPYENSLVTLRASGKTVREALERSAECMAERDEGPRSCDSLEGADYEIDLSRPPGRRVVFLRRLGKDVADGDVFTVALNSHRAAGGGGYPMWKRAQRLAEKGNVREMLVADARAQKTLRLSATGNWKVQGSR